MAHKKRTNKLPMETLLVASGNQALASGSLATSGASVNIADGQLGVLSWDLNSSVRAQGVFLQAGDTAAQVKAIKLLQGTPNSSNTLNASVLHENDLPFVQTDVIYRDKVRSVAFMEYKPGIHSSALLHTVATPVDDITQYGIQIRVVSPRRQGQIDAITRATFTSPDYSVTSVGNKKDHVLQNLIHEANRNSQAVGGGSVFDLHPYVVLGINSAGSFGVVIDDLLGDSVVPFITVDGITYNLTLTDDIKNTICKMAASECIDTAVATVEVVDVCNAGAKIASQGVVTFSGQPSDTQTITIGATTYEFVASLVGANDVLIGASTAATLANLVAAVNGAAGEGTTYGTGTVANASATAVATSGTVITLTAITAGTAGNSIALSETASNVTVTAFAKGADSKVDNLLVIGLNEKRAAAYENVLAYKPRVELQAVLGLYTIASTSRLTEAFEGYGRGEVLERIYNDRDRMVRRGTLVNWQYQFDTVRAVSYIDPAKAYNVTIIEYYDESETLTISQESPNRTFILLEADADVTQCPIVVSTDSTTVSSINGILGAWLTSAASYSDIEYVGEAASGDIA